MGPFPTLNFERESHRNYLNSFLYRLLPSHLASLDSSRSVIAFFCVAGLDILGEAEKLTEEDKDKIVQWIYSLQVINCEEPVSGFQGSPAGNVLDARGKNAPYKWGHIATTYSCLLTLLILGDDLSQVNRKEVIRSLKALQLADGSFKGALEGVEDDMRFVYCASCISYILGDWSGVDVERMLDFIFKSISYDGGIGQGPGLESHCGSTFCAIASLALSNNLDKLSEEQFKSLRRWLLFRLEVGFNGRPNKPSDTCYSFWTGGALKILNAYQFIEAEENPGFVLMTQDKYGGFSKWVNSGADPMHSYFGLAGLSLMKYGGLKGLFPALNCTEEAHDRLKQLHKRWRH